MRRTNRSGKGVGKGLDLTELRKLVKRMVPMATALGVVRKFPGEESHYEIQIDSETGAREVMVDVELMPSSERVFCRLGFGSDQVYKIPRVDQEVAVLIPFSRNSLIQDELDFDPVIVAVLDTEVPEELDSDDVYVITSPRVIVISDSIQLGANAEPLATLADVQALRTTFNNHGHIYSPGPSTPIATAGPQAPLGLPTTYASAPSGTSIVTGE